MKLHDPITLNRQHEVKLQDGSWQSIENLQSLSLNDQLMLLKKLGEAFPFMPDSPKDSSLSFPAIAKINIVDSVTFFGGSFYPFHAGHMNCLETCPEKNIIVVPDCNPHKIQIEKNSPWETFITLLKILKDKPYSLYPGFLGNNVPNPTANWIVNVDLPEVNFLMGDDSFMNLFWWTRPEDILRTLTKLYVVPRDHERPDYEEQLKKIHAINPRLQVIILPDHPFRQLSSTSFRTLK